MNKHSFAFPRAYSEQHDSTRGMTLRQYTAIELMKAYMGDPNAHWSERHFRSAAQTVIEMTDILLEELDE
jgi:hypothetical protein